MGILRVMHPLSYLKLTASTWAYDRSWPVLRLQRCIASMYEMDHCLATSNGRTALFTILRGLAASPGDEVILQAFTCVAAVNPILWAGLTPVFVDVDPTNLGPSLDSIVARISPRTRAVLVQHTFGMTVKVEAIVNLARPRAITVIEDCAHAFGAGVGGAMPGVSGDVAMLSFGIDKLLSSKAGGAIVAGESELMERISREWSALPRLDRGETLRWLLYPLVSRAIRRLPGDAGQRAAGRLRRAGVLRQAVTPAELHGGLPPGTPARLSGALAEVILSEMDGLPANLDRRASITARYAELLRSVPAISIPAAARGPLIRFPLLCPDRGTRDGLRRHLVAQGFDVTAWYDPPVFPRGVDTAAIGYNAEQNPIAEDLAGRVLCLPTGRNIADAGVDAIAGIIIEHLGRSSSPPARTGGALSPGKMSPIAADDVIGIDMSTETDDDT